MSNYAVQDNTHEAKKIECQECKHIAPSENRLKAHVRLVHSEENLKKCKICPYVGKYLWRHMKDAHVNNRSYECSICNNRFSRADNLKRHIRKKHFDSCDNSPGVLSI